MEKTEEEELERRFPGNVVVLHGKVKNCAIANVGALPVAAINNGLRNNFLHEAFTI